MAQPACFTAVTLALSKVGLPSVCIQAFTVWWTQAACDLLLPSALFNWFSDEPLQVKLPLQKGQKSAQAIGEVLCQTAQEMKAAILIIASHGT